MATITKTGNRVNGLDLEALGSVVREIERDAKKGMVAFRVSTAWRGQTKSRSTVESYTIGGQEVRRHFELDVDEPHELLGQNSAPNPQEMLMAAFNACITVGYVAGAALKGITLEKVEIETAGELDLRGFLGIDPGVRPGYESIRYTVRIKGNGTSPNYFNVSRPIRIDAALEVQ